MNELHTAFNMDLLKPFLFSSLVPETKTEPVVDHVEEARAELERAEAEAEAAALAQRNLASVLLQYLFVPDKAEATVGVLLGIDFGKEGLDMARDEFANTKACENIITAMRQLSESASMQWKCCKLIMNLTRNFAKSKLAFLNADAVDAIASAMRSYPFDEELQMFGCGALRNLSSVDAAKIVEDGGLQSILLAMKHHPHCEELQSAAAISLYNLTCCENGKYIEKIIDLGGGARLADAHYLYKGKTMSKVEEFACNALKILYCSETTQSS